MPLYTPPGYIPELPADRQVVEWNFDPQGAGYSAAAFTSGTIYGTSFIARTGSTISKVGVDVSAAAITPTAGENLIGLYTASGTTWTQQAVTGDLGTWGATTFNPYALSQSLTLAAGNPYVVLFLSVAATAVVLGGLSGNSNFSNVNCNNNASPWLRYFTGGTAQTALPASFVASGSTMSTSNVKFPWVALL